jgi:hypothetical protein
MGGQFVMSPDTTGQEARGLKAHGRPGVAMTIAMREERPRQAPAGRTTTQGSWRWLRRVQAFDAALADKLARRAR